MSPTGNSYWESFEIPGAEKMTVLGALERLNQRPLTVYGVAVNPIVWEDVASLECQDAPLMRINGEVAVPQKLLVKNLSVPIVVEPLNAFPVLRDLWVDRGKIHAELKQRGCVRPFDGLGDLSAPFLARQESGIATDMAACSRCGACLEFGNAVSMALSSLSEGKPPRDYFPSLMRHGGVLDVENCAESEAVCPYKIPLKAIVQKLRRQTFRFFLRQMF